MSGERLGSGITAGLIACLSIGILLLGIELSSAVRDGGSLPPVNAGVLGAAAALLYAALAWRGSRGRGGRMFIRWWGSMVLGHALLGVTVGLASATLASAPADTTDVALWAGAGSLPMAVLQVGYSIGVSSLAWGDQPEPVVAVGRHGNPPRPPLTEDLPAPPVPTCREPEQAPDRAGRLATYASAIERLQADDHQTLVRFATQAARCEGGLLATSDGLVVAAVEPRSLDASRVAAVLPELVRDLGRLAGPVTEAPSMLHAALGGYELLAVPGGRLTGCLIGPEPGAREVAEVILPVLVARAEQLRPPDPPAGTELCDSPDNTQFERESPP